MLCPPPNDFKPVLLFRKVFIPAKIIGRVDSIAHRLQTIQEADRVLVLDHGEIAELGAHEELLALKGLYYTLHNLQFQDAISDKPEQA